MLSTKNVEEMDTQAMPYYGASYLPQWLFAQTKFDPGIRAFPAEKIQFSIWARYRNTFETLTPF